jgi:hypothetical protein
LEFAHLKVSGSNSLSVTFYVESVYIEQKKLWAFPHVGGEIDILILLSLWVRYRVFKKKIEKDLSMRSNSWAQPQTKYIQAHTHKSGKINVKKFDKGEGILVKSYKKWRN